MTYICNYLLFFFQAGNNLVVLARETGGAEIIVQHDGITKIKDFLMSEKNPDFLQAGIRVLSCLTNENRDRVSSGYKTQTL